MRGSTDTRLVSAAGAAVTAPADARPAEAHDRCSRVDMLKRLLAGTGIVGLGSLLVFDDPVSSAPPSQEEDVRILNFLLLLEYIQQGFYSAGTATGALRGELRRIARVAEGHEREHVDELRRVLGGKARPKPHLDIGKSVRDAARFTAAALTLEESASAAYIGQAANLTQQRVPVVARIVPVEARHAAWLRDVAGRLPAPLAADRAQGADHVMRTIDRLGFVSGS